RNAVAGRRTRLAGRARTRIRSALRAALGCRRAPVPARVPDRKRLSRPEILDCHARVALASGNRAARAPALPVSPVRGLAEPFHDTPTPAPAPPGRRPPARLPAGAGRGDL